MDHNGPGARPGARLEAQSQRKAPRAGEEGRGAGHGERAIIWESQEVISGHTEPIRVSGPDGNVQEDQLFIRQTRLQYCTRQSK